jgi:predicted aldo/keto reductase-like oxidoreductase
MKSSQLSRRQFIEKSAALAGAAWFAPTALAAAEPAKQRTAVDQVTLGKTGIRLSRLGIGTGTNSGEVQRALGHEGFNRLLRYAYDQGITYIDTAQNYQNHEWVRAAIKGLPREKLFIQTKMPGLPDKPLEVIDRYRKELDTDYLDSLLMHAMVKRSWPDDQKRLMDALEEAKARKLIRAKGISCHSLPALGRSTETDWVEVQLVRVNPQAKHIDGLEETWNRSGDDIQPVLKEIKAMRQKGKGIIAMKLIGNGDFTQPEDREQSIRFAMQCGLLDAAVIGFKSSAEIDEAITRINRALAAAA